MKPSRPQFRARKSLGQNFLVDPNIIKKIVDASQIKAGETVLEIGPGRGAITEGISEKAKHVIAVEKDKWLAQELEQRFQQTNVNILQKDILRLTFNGIRGKVKVIGNLPYNIATPIITKMIDNRNKIEDMYLTVQWEYGKRIVARPNTSDYGSFSCFVQFYTEPKLLFKIKSSSFRPAPKVQSCFLRLTPLKAPLYKVKDEERLLKVIRASFNQRRKSVQNSLRAVIGKEKVGECLEKAGVNPALRAENLHLKDFVNIANTI